MKRSGWCGVASPMLGEPDINVVEKNSHVVTRHVEQVWNLRTNPHLVVFCAARHAVARRLARKWQEKTL
jgi:hypothetical protein